MALRERDLRVLYALSRWPKASMSELAQALGISLSTLSSIKTVLLKAVVLRPSIVALPKVLGMNYRGVDTAPIMPGTTSRKVLEIIDRSSIESGVTYKLMMDGARYNIQALSRDRESMSFFLSGLDAISGKAYVENDEDRLRLIFPLDQEIMHNIADQSGLIRHSFGIDVEPLVGMSRQNPGPLAETAKDMPSPQSLRALPLFVGSPIRKDSEIAHVLNVSKQRVGKIRQELMERKLIVRNNIIDHASLGMETIGLFYIVYQMDRTIEEISDFEERIRVSFDPFFWARNGHMSTFDYWFRGLKELKRFRAGLFSLSEDPPIDRMKAFFLSGDITTHIRYLSGERKDRGEERIAKGG